MTNTRFMTRGRTIAASIVAAAAVGGLGVAAAAPSFATDTTATTAPGAAQSIPAGPGIVDDGAKAGETDFDPAALAAIQEGVREGLPEGEGIGVPVLDAAVAGSHAGEAVSGTRYAVGYTLPGIGTTVTDLPALTTWEEEVDGTTWIFFVSATNGNTVSNPDAPRFDEWSAAGNVRPVVDEDGNAGELTVMTNETID